MHIVKVLCLAGVYSAQPYVQPGVYPHAAPSPTASYDTSIGFSLGGGVNTYPQPQPGHHQPQVRIIIHNYY